MTVSPPVVLVTGGAGYIGSQTCKTLSQSGFRPVVFDNLSTGHRWAVRWGPLVEGDLLDPAQLDQAMASHAPVAVVHFAALAYVGESVRDPQSYYRNNVVGTLNLLDAMHRHNVRRMVFSSSCATYGVPQRVPIREDHPQDPINPYGRTKLVIEQALGDYASAYGIQSAALRYFNAAGADSDLEVGESHDPETHLIPRVLAVAAGLEPVVTIFGNQHDTPDGTCIRDYVHVEDLAGAHVAALGVLNADTGAQAFNLGIGRGYSVREVIDVARQVTGIEIPVQEGPARRGDPPQLVADAAHAADQLGWSPRYRELDSMVESAWRWLQKSHDQAPDRR